MNKAKYYSWIRIKRIIFILLITLGLLLIALIGINLYVSLIAAVLSLPFIYLLFLLSYTYYQFAEFGGNYQNKIHALLVNQIRIQSGKLLDIGTGSASLIIKAARAFPLLKLTGIDYWGAEWEYSKKLCETNAQIEGVADRIEFRKGSASKLPFQHNDFGIVVSCLTFHEVNDEPDKMKVIKEAFRVLKKDGEFVFLDLFLDSSKFGNYLELENSIKNMGISKVEAIKLDKIIALPKILLHKNSLGNAVILKGKK